jgi:hypothetical protein
MKRLAAGLAASVLAASATMFVFAGTAMAASPTCVAKAEAPTLSGGGVLGGGGIKCSTTAVFTLEIKVWRNNGNGTYTSWFSIEENQVSGGNSLTARPKCVSGLGTLQWHTEAIIYWDIYSGSSLVADGNSSTNSSDVNLNCH